MGISIGGRDVATIFHGSDPISEVYHGSDLIWSASPPTLQADLGWERARTGPMKIMFLGSSTTDGYGTTRNESYVTQVASLMVKHVVGAPATAPVKQNTGTVTARTATGFHFLNAGVGGTTTSNYYGPTRGTLLGGWQPDLVFHMIGSNDYSQQVPLSTVKDNLRSVILDADARTNARAQHIFVHSYRRMDRADTGITWAQYGEAIREVTEGHDNCHFLDANVWWEHLGGGEWALQGDKIHALWTGNWLLARAVAAGLGLDDHDDELIYGFDAAEWDHLSDGTRMSSFQPIDGSLVTESMRASGDDRPTLRVNGSVRALDFTGGNRRMETVGWPGAHSLPLTVYIVTSSLGDSGTNSQPFFTRSVADDDGYVWAWRERDAGLLKGASNSAFNQGVTLDPSTAGQPMVIAVTFLASGHIGYYVNSLVPQSTGVDRPSEGNAPWMKSLKIGTNTGNTAWSEMIVREMHWHHGDTASNIHRHIRELANKHGIKITTRVSDWSETTSAAAIDATVPDWADTVELVAVGAGGGGAGGGLFSTGDGGRSGAWIHGTVEVSGGETITAMPGLGGSGGSSNSSNGAAGGAATVRIGGQEVLRASGGGAGTSTNGNQPGRAAGNHSAFGRTFTGGAAASNGQAGNPPGGGGGPGAPLSSGNPGGQGRVWWRFVAH
ncbi:SGNH/GDSL hydrolase family protein [Corynebacteriaceae bacterium 7-707]